LPEYSWEYLGDVPAGSAFQQIVDWIILNEVDEFKILSIYMQNLENNLEVVPLSIKFLYTTFGR
jgi:hypothetical protein